MQQRLQWCTFALLLLLVLVPGSDALEDRADAFIGYREGATVPALDFKHFVLTTGYGAIRIRPRNDLSPKIVKLVKELAQSGSCPQCKFYRHEPAPANFGKDGFYGPPYALLQGSLASMAEQPPFEGAPEVHKGDVCIIPNSREFFIATAGHEEWGHSHSVWGQVADDASWAVIARVPEEPFTTITDGGGITTRWLTPNVTEPFKLSIE